MSRWFRFYDETLNDPKILKLSDKLYRVWTGILCVASKNNGLLPPLEDMALMIRMTPAKLDEAIKSLMIAGLIDDDGVSLTPHNWNARQFKSDVSNERVQRYRERKRNVTVAPPETETETEKKEYCPVAKPTRTKLEYSEEFETKFWQPYPRSPTMSKSEAWKAWVKLSLDQQAASCKAIEPYKRLLRSKPNLETVHACRFLSQERYEGLLSSSGSAPAFDIRSHLV